MSPYVHISMSDSGAHTRILTNSLWPVHFPPQCLRDREILSLEQAHHKIRAYLAWWESARI